MSSTSPKIFIHSSNNPHNPFPIQLPLSEQHKRERTKLEMRILVSTAMVVAVASKRRESESLYMKSSFEITEFSKPRAPLLSSSSSCLQNATMYISIISECKKASEFRWWGEGKGKMCFAINDNCYRGALHTAIFRMYFMIPQ